MSNISNLHGKSPQLSANILMEVFLDLANSLLSATFCQDDVFLAKIFFCTETVCLMQFFLLEMSQNYIFWDLYMSSRSPRFYEVNVQVD